MLLGQSADRLRSQARDVVQRRAGAIEDRRNRVERLPGQLQLAGAADPRVAGEDLLDQGRARARQAEHEDGPSVVRSRSGKLSKSSAVNPRMTLSTY